MIDETRVAAIAAQCNPQQPAPPQPPLTDEERLEILREIEDMCKQDGTLIDRLYKAPDHYLCMALVTAWSMKFCQEATGRTPGEKNVVVLYPTD